MKITGRPYSLSLKKFGTGKKINVLASVKLTDKAQRDIWLSLGKKSVKTLARLIYAKNVTFVVGKDFKCEIEQINFYYFILLYNKFYWDGHYTKATIREITPQPKKIKIEKESESEASEQSEAEDEPEVGDESAEDASESDDASQSEDAASDNAVSEDEYKPSDSESDSDATEASEIESEPKRKGRVY